MPEDDARTQWSKTDPQGAVTKGYGDTPSPGTETPTPPAEPSRHHWHGFPTVMDAIRALAWLATLVVTMTTGVIAYAVGQLDERYAPFAVVEQIKENGEVAKTAVTQINQVRMSMIRTELLNTKERSCKAQSAESKSFYAREIQRLVNEYRELEQGRDPFIPSCEDF